MPFPTTAERHVLLPFYPFQQSKSFRNLWAILWTFNAAKKSQGRFSSRVENVKEEEKEDKILKIWEFSEIRVLYSLSIPRKADYFKKLSRDFPFPLNHINQV